MINISSFKPEIRHELIEAEIEERLDEAVLEINETQTTVKDLQGLILASMILIPCASCITIGAIINQNLNDNIEKSNIEKRDYILSIESKIEDLKKSLEEDYEKRFDDLSDKIKAIDRKLEETKNDTYTETIIFTDEIPEAECSKERLPEGVDTNRYDCEHYSFGYGTDQYWLQLACYTDEKGLRYFSHNGKKYYCVAMGGAYGIDIGDTWDVTLECGTTFGVILSDYQHSIEEVDPNDFGERYVYDSYGNVVDLLRNYDGEPVVHVLEFIVDIDSIPKSVLRAGTVSKLDEFGGLYGDGGNIIDISYQGRAWSI